jgi:hypothetical protein
MSIDEKDEGNNEDDDMFVMTLTHNGAVAWMCFSWM